MPTRPLLHETDDQAVASVQKVLSLSGLASEVVHKDYGEDLVVHISIGEQMQPARYEQLSRVVDEKVKHQAATFSSVVVVSSSVTLSPSLNFTSSSTSVTSSWPLNRRQRSWAPSRSL